MGRGVSAGGGQSSLGYLFGGGENTNDNTNHRASGQSSNNMTSASAAPSQQPLDNPPQIPTTAVDSKTEVDSSKPSPTSTHDSKKNNYFRPDGQNCGNFITDRPSTKVHAAPGGGSSLGYLFGDGKN